MGSATRRSDEPGVDAFQSLYLAFDRVGPYLAEMDADIASQIRARVWFPRLLSAQSESDAAELDAVIEQHYVDRLARLQARRRPCDPP